jgi:hypothetical protein
MSESVAPLFLPGRIQLSRMDLKKKIPAGGTLTGSAELRIVAPRSANF